MIRKILTYYAEQLDEYLSRFYHRPEGLATVGMIGNAKEERPNKMVVALLNVERETSGGISPPHTTHRRWKICPDAATLTAEPEHHAGGSFRRAAVCRIFVPAFGHVAIHPVHAEIHCRRNGLYDRDGEYLHTGHEQCLDAAGRAILPIRSMQDTPPEHRWREHHRQWQNVRQAGYKNVTTKNKRIWTVTA